MGKYFHPLEAKHSPTANQHMFSLLQETHLRKEFAESSTPHLKEAMLTTTHFLDHPTLDYFYDSLLLMGVTNYITVPTFFSID
jgi:hypothetical protein